MMKNWSFRFEWLSLVVLSLVGCASPSGGPTENGAPPIPHPKDDGAGWTVGVQEAAIQLWPDGNPGGWIAKGPEKSEVGGDQVLRVSQVSAPTLTYYPPRPTAPTSSTAVVICPGGGYRILALNKEGSDVAEFLASHGYHAFVLKYRLPNQGEIRYQAALEDAQRAMEMVRARGEELGIDAVGIMGFSAGGHLAAATAAATAAVPVDEDSTRPSPAAIPPDFVALVYPAYFFRDKQSQQLAPEIAPGKNPPPAFMVHALNDRIPARNSIVYAEALAALKVPAEVHLYARGGHGYGMTLTDKLPVGDWPNHLLKWLSRQSAASK
jgi:acetyl esterase/lipase